MTKTLLNVRSIQTAILLFFFSSCAKGPHVPVNVGREYGSPKTPWVVSHIPESNQWALARSKPHNVFQRILCFHYPCRKMIGRRKVLNAISMEAFKKRIRKNAKKGLYKKYRVNKLAEPDTLVIQKDSVIITQEKVLPKVKAPALKADSLITLSEFLFQVDSHMLSENHYSELDSLSSFLKKRPKLEVNISGHTDNTGSERHNVNLSTRRAEVVALFLLDHGVAFDKVFYKGYGSSKPISENDTEEGRRLNRRVEILIKKSEF